MTLNLLSACRDLSKAFLSPECCLGKPLSSGGWSPGNNGSNLMLMPMAPILDSRSYSEGSVSVTILSPRLRILFIVLNEISFTQVPASTFISSKRHLSLFPALPWMVSRTRSPVRNGLGFSSLGSNPIMGASWMLELPTSLTSKSSQAFHLTIKLCTMYHF